MDDLKGYARQVFDNIKKINEYGSEYWTARELAKILGYKDFRNFLVPVDKAMESCKNSGQNILDHFGEATNMINIGKGGKRLVDDYNLSRYACYLIVQNADSSKEIVALGQTYFAVQTRRQELQDEYAFLSEDEKRLSTRKQIAEHNKSLASAAKSAGIIESKDYAIFQNSGYQGLYGGLGMKDIHARKGIKKSQHILDHMGSTELAANLFRATQTDEKLRRDNIKGKEVAYQIHKEVGKKVRKAIKDIGGTMPENLPTPEKSIKQIERENQKKLIE